MKYLLILFSIVAACQAVTFFKLVLEEWETFKVWLYEYKRDDESSYCVELECSVVTGDHRLMYAKTKNDPLNIYDEVLKRCDDKIKFEPIDIVIVKKSWNVLVFINVKINISLEHGKIYKSEVEDKFRMKIYMENKHNIAKHNAAFELGHKNFKLEMNRYGDMLLHEFTQTMNGFKRIHSGGLKRRLDTGGATFIRPANVKIPDFVDWRKHGAVTPIKDQGSCGSCWSFSATGSLEGQHFRKSGVLVSLSEQNLIDCSGQYGNEGCNGGIMDSAFQYVRDNRGIDTEVSYPYEAENDVCRYNPKSSGASDVGFTDIAEGSEDQLKEAVATIGPISVAIDASHESFQFYKGGVYYEPECNSTALDHGVLVIGYGTDEITSEDYWLVKNSWGTTWGEEGYVKMARNRDNHCGIASEASYPLV